MTTILWLRQDLRLSDHAALHAAAQTGPVIPLYIRDDSAEGYAQPGAASKWWLHHSLIALEQSLCSRGSRLILRSGRPQAVLEALCHETRATSVVWQRCYEPHATARDELIKTSFKSKKIGVRSYPGSLLLEPWEIANGSGQPFKVFTPFWKASLSKLRHLQEPLPIPDALPSPDHWPDSESLETWQYQPTRPNWASRFPQFGTPGEQGAQDRLREFLNVALNHYQAERDLPGGDATSRLSAHLHWGEITPRQIWHATFASQATAENKAKFLSEIGWREFSAHLLFHFPSLPTHSFRPEFERFPWRDDPAFRKAWQRGQTGYPIVDAGMRELWATGRMHNRVRMIAASFLIKHGLQHWHHGQSWFWDTLTDADLASNAASWQWVAGSGADAAPYFRIFNPILQGQKFDPQGEYIRRWVPELANLPADHIHTPWKAAAPPRHYPAPIVEHDKARKRALAAFQSLRVDASAT